jgi:hypothetical protein
MAFYLVETLDQLKTFYNMGYKQAFVEVIPYNDNLHPMLNKTSLVYIKPLDEKGEKGYWVNEHTKFIRKDTHELFYICYINEDPIKSFIIEDNIKITNIGNWRN